MRVLFSQKGITLVELLITMTVLAIFSVGLYQIVRSGTGAFKRGDQQVDVQATGRTVLAQIAREIREAKFYDQDTSSGYWGNDYFFCYLGEPGNTSNDFTTYPAVKYYYDATSHRLIRRFWPAPSGGTEGNPDPTGYEEKVVLENVVNDVSISAESIFETNVDFSRLVSIRLILQAPTDKSPAPPPGTTARQNWRETRMQMVDVMPRNP